MPSCSETRRGSREVVEVQERHLVWCGLECENKNSLQSSYGPDKSCCSHEFIESVDVKVINIVCHLHLETLASVAVLPESLRLHFSLHFSFLDIVTEDLSKKGGAIRSPS